MPGVMLRLLCARDQNHTWRADLSRRKHYVVATLLVALVLMAIGFWRDRDSRDTKPNRVSTSGSTTDPAKAERNRLKHSIEKTLLTTPWPPIELAKHMKIHDRASAEQVRAAIVEFVFPNGRPSHDPLTKQPDTSFPATELWTLTMRNDIVSRMFFIRAEEAEGACLFLFHNGHGHPTKSITSIPIVRALVDRFTKNGCDVLLLSMPLNGVNNDPHFQSDNPHDELRAFEAVDLSPFSYFIEPVLRGLDEATKEKSYSRIGMAGLSGGAWTTTFAGAIEPRLKNVYPVAGSMPFALDIPPELVGGRNVSSLRGDYEQSHSFYKTVADYLDLYLLDVYGPDRRAVHFYIQKDQCCFFGAASHAFSEQLTRLAKDITGNSLQFVVDHAAQRHEVSSSTLEAIFADFSRGSSSDRSSGHTP